MPAQFSTIQLFSEKMISDSPLNIEFNGFQLSVLSSSSAQTLEFQTGSVFLFVQSGKVELAREGSFVQAGAGHFASRKSPVSVKLHPHTHIIIVQTPSDTAVLDMMGGPVETEGRLQYIDNCSDTLLLHPALLGEPCLNFLHFPPGTNQTSHYHPSFRFGIVIRGQGLCLEGPRDESGAIQSTRLNPGDAFLIPPDVMHSFSTTDSAMDVIAFHPDSDWGPTNADHPMINRTWVDGKKI